MPTIDKKAHVESYEQAAFNNKQNIIFMEGPLCRALGNHCVSDFKR